jgi:hypothetical protein
VLLEKIVKNFPMEPVHRRIQNMYIIMSQLNPIHSHHVLLLRSKSDALCILEMSVQHLYAGRLWDRSLNFNPGGHSLLNARDILFSMFAATLHSDIYLDRLNKV